MFPSQLYKDDLHRLLAQILFFKAEKLMIVGDLTHSIANSELTCSENGEKILHRWIFTWSKAIMISSGKMV